MMHMLILGPIKSLLTVVAVVAGAVYLLGGHDVQAAQSTASTMTSVVGVAAGVTAGSIDNGVAGFRLGMAGSDPLAPTMAPKAPAKAPAAKKAN